MKLPSQAYLARLSKKALQALAEKFARAQERAEAAKAYRAREPFATCAKNAAIAKRNRRNARNLQAVGSGGMTAFVTR